MGHSQAEKTRTHERIVALAAKRLREEGVHGIGLAALMREAGLTVGGFYRHFASRDDLVAEAVGASVGKWPAATATAEGGGPIRFADLLDRYLSPAHRDSPGTGCTLGALAADLARCEANTRAAATRRLCQDIDLLAGSLEGDRDRAVLAFSAMVGALTLSRLAADPALSDEILATVRAALAAPRAAG